jgi:beta-N-acetylhexosaminidase
LKVGLFGVFTLVVVLGSACSGPGGRTPSPVQHSPSASSPAAAPAAPPTSRARSHSGGPSASKAPSPVPTSVAVSPSATSVMLARMSLPERVGQLFMVGAPAAGDAGQTLALLRQYHVGSVILTGRSSLGVEATAHTTAVLQSVAHAASTVGLPLLIATDQEGGMVQVLRGPGFGNLPTALQQGATSADSLRVQAEAWGFELHAAGINVELAPVLDVVPDSGARSNAPIGAFDRQFGQDPAKVAEHGLAFIGGMENAGVSPTIKHFPGLGRVNGNPDNSSAVTDDVTSRQDAYLMPFVAAIRAGAPIVMVSTATYRLLDPNSPAAFSRTIVTGILRGDLSFTGLVISDDLGRAVQVRGWSPGERAVDFISAGGDLVLTVEPRVIPEMFAAVMSKAQRDPVFRAQVDAAALRVLSAKRARGLFS